MAAKQSIAFVANTSWSIYKFRLNLIENLLKNGFAIYVLAPRDTYTSQFELLPGLTYIELSHFRAKSISPMQDGLLYRELLRHYRRHPTRPCLSLYDKSKYFRYAGCIPDRNTLSQRDHGSRIYFRRQGLAPVCR